ncbi:MAG: hypothetical protein AAFR73_09790 [Pseudomonadota bacterium]
MKIFENTDTYAETVRHGETVRLPLLLFLATLALHRIVSRDQ